ncbi:MAG: DUF1802 family protein [Actinomycetota bacterium]
MLQIALSLPLPDVDALIEGRMIVALPRIFLNLGRTFALYPAPVLSNSLSAEQQYRSNYLPIAQRAIAQLNSEKVTIKAWARCEFCQMLNEPESLAALSQLTIWTTEALQQTLQQRPYIFLAYLRVYLLPQPLEMPVHSSGNFVPLPHPLTVFDSSPVLSDAIFSKRRQQLEKLEPPIHPELEELQSALIQIPINNLTPKEITAVKQLEREIQILWNWSSAAIAKQPALDLAWIDTIAALADRSLELDEGKSNYQAGTDFEIIVRRSLEFLGFTVDEAYKGGAGGLDLFCSKPYSLVGECKAGKTIPDRTVEELDRIGKRHLRENYQTAVRLIIGPGEPTKNLRESAQVSKTSIIKAMTLQKLVQLQAKYPGFVDLIELKNKYLKPGCIDSEIDRYIEKKMKEIRGRSQIIQLVKQYLENTSHEVVSVEALHGAYSFSNPSQPLSSQDLHELLIELSSPLTGYLGRIKGENWKGDRFYFLRNLPVDD